jgi:TM2 domain
MTTPSLPLRHPALQASPGDLAARPPTPAPVSGTRGLPRKSWVVAVQLSLVLGMLGADRFYLGYTRLGVLKLATLGGCGLWALVDLVLIMRGQITDAHGRSLQD